MFTERLYTSETTLILSRPHFANICSSNLFSRPYRLKHHRKIDKKLIPCLPYRVHRYMFISKIQETSFPIFCAKHIPVVHTPLKTRDSIKSPSEKNGHFMTTKSILITGNGHIISSITATRHFFSTFSWSFFP